MLSDVGQSATISSVLFASQAMVGVGTKTPDIKMEGTTFNVVASVLTSGHCLGCAPYI